MSDGAQPAFLQVLLPPHPIVHRVAQRIHKEPVHGEVSATGIGLRITKRHGIRAATIGVITLRPKSGHLKGVPVFHHQNHPEALTHGMCLGKERLHLFRPSAGGHIIILRRHPAELIAHTPPHEVGLMSGLLQTAEQIKHDVARCHGKKNARP